MIRVTSRLLAAGLLLAVGGRASGTQNRAGTAEAPRVLRLAHGLPTDHPVHLAMVAMVARVDSVSGGRLQLAIYPSGQLGSERECLELLQVGSLAMAKVSSGVLAFVNVLAAMLFGAISGSAVAAASAIGSTVGPRMVEEGYGRNFAAAVNITAATTGLIIPPSNVRIVYSLASGGASIAAVIRPLLPLYGAMAVALALVTAVPQLSLWLPSLFGF